MDMNIQIMSKEKLTVKKVGQLSVTFAAPSFPQKTLRSNTQRESKSGNRYRRSVEMEFSRKYPFS